MDVGAVYILLKPVGPCRCAVSTGLASNFPISVGAMWVLFIPMRSRSDAVRTADEDERMVRRSVGHCERVSGGDCSVVGAISDEGTL